MRNDLTKYKANILNPRPTPRFSRTSDRRFTLFIPKKNIVFSIQPGPRLVPPEQKPQAASYAHQLFIIPGRAPAREREIQNSARVCAERAHRGMTSDCHGARAPRPSAYPAARRI